MYKSVKIRLRPYPEIERKNLNGLSCSIPSDASRMHAEMRVSRPTFLEDFKKSILGWMMYHLLINFFKKKLVDFKLGRETVSSALQEI